VFGFMDGGAGNGDRNISAGIGPGLVQSCATAPVGKPTIDPVAAHATEFVANVVNIAAGFTFQMCAGLVHTTVGLAPFKPYTAHPTESVGFSVVSATEIKNHSHLMLIRDPPPT